MQCDNLILKHNGMALTDLNGIILQLSTDAMFILVPAIMYLMLLQFCEIPFYAQSITIRSFIIAQEIKKSKNAKISKRKKGAWTLETKAAPKVVVHLGIIFKKQPQMVAGYYMHVVSPHTMRKSKNMNRAK